MLTTIQETLIGHLLTARTVRAACRKAGVSERSYRDWIKTNEFRNALRDARRESLAEAVGVLTGLMAPAATTLRKALGAKRDADRIRAALGILDRALRGVEFVELADRVAELERLTASRGGEI
jgi:hypothetical protein